MVQAVNGNIVHQREFEYTRETHRPQWRTQFIGSRANDSSDNPQAFLAEMSGDGLVVPHFHQVNQYQVLIAGHGMLGRHTIGGIAVHYADHHTAYGPIKAGPMGLSFFTIRARSDAGPVYLHNPEHKQKLAPTPKRYLLANNIAISTEPVLCSRTEVGLDRVFDEVFDDSDGLGAYTLRMGAGMKTAGPDPASTDGQYYLIINGSVRHKDELLPPCSLIYVSPLDAPLQVCAGPAGVEALVLNFPRPVH